MAADDVFEVASSIRVHNPCLNVDVIIHAAFIKEVEDECRFVLLDFYQSRGVYSLLSSRLPQVAGKRAHAKILAKVVADLRRKRDEVFRKSVQADVPDGANARFGRGVASVAPKNRRVKVVALSKRDGVSVEMEAFTEEFDGFHLSCIVPFERQNGNSELWVDSQGSTWNYLSKLVAHEYGKSLDGDDDVKSAVVAEPTTQIAHSPKRQSTSDDPGVASASPSKRQTTLLGFLKQSFDRGAGASPIE